MTGRSPAAIVYSPNQDQLLVSRLFTVLRQRPDAPAAFGSTEVPPCTTRPPSTRVKYVPPAVRPDRRACTARRSRRRGRAPVSPARRQLLRRDLASLRMAQSPCKATIDYTKSTPPLRISRNPRFAENRLTNSPPTRASTAMATSGMMIVNEIEPVAALLPSPSEVLASPVETGIVESCLARRMRVRVRVAVTSDRVTVGLPYEGVTALAQ